MHFDGTITLGNLLSAVMVLAVGYAGWVAFRTRVDVMIQTQREAIERQDRRLDSHEARDEELFDKIQVRLGDLAAGIQRLVGQNDIVFRQKPDRRQP